MSDQWISAREAARRLGLKTYHHVPGVAEASGIRRRHLPGRPWVEYLAGDVEQLARQSVIGAGVPEHGQVVAEAGA